MKIQGKNLTLTLATVNDVDTIHDWENDPQYWLVSNTVAPYSKDQIESFILNSNDVYEAGQTRLMIRLNHDEIVGCIDLYDFDPKNSRAGVGILIDPLHRGKGFGHEALTILKDYSFDKLEMHSLFAEVLKGNTSSIHLFESVGFKCIGVRKDWVWNGKEFVDQCIYQVIRGNEG